MDEYQISDLITSNASIIYMNADGFATMVSAYIAMAYFVGSKLTRFQVSFINFVFIGLTVTGTLAAAQYTDVVLELSIDLEILRSDVAQPAGASEALTNAYFLFRFVVIGGCIIFMRSARHGSPFGKNT